MPSLIRDEHGAALVEMTVAAPLLIVLAIGAMIFGQAMLDYVTVDKSMRDATRFLARLPSGAICDSSGWALTSAKNLAVYGQETVGTTPVITGWSTSTISMTSPDCGGSVTAPFSIQLTTAFPYTNSMLGAIGLSTTLTMSVTHVQPAVGY
jgi:Flp pilus assembly protein TadG